MKRIFRSAILLSILCLVALNGFAAGEKETAGMAKTYRVYAVVHGGIGDPYWKKVENGIKAADALATDLEVVYTGPDVFNFEQFMGMLQGALAAKPDGLLATMTNPEAMDALLRNAIKGGLPVIAIDSPDSRPPLERIPYISYIGEIPYEGGVLAAKTILQQYRPKRAIYGNHHPGALNLTERGQGFLDIMKAAGVQAEALDITEDPVQGAEIMLSYLRRNPNTDTVFTGNMLRAETLVTRMKEEGMSPGKTVHISTFGLEPSSIEMLKAGEIDFSIDEQPYMQGFLGVTYMYLHLKYGFTPPAESPTLGLFPEDVSQLEDLIAQGIR
jgi:simple sugar transport system substrate-binding protein